jgi:ADP-heptose:LPS heptosyltransferase
VTGGHVLVARLDGDGDVLLTAPAVRAVANRARQVTFLCRPAGAPVARLLPGVDEVVTFLAPWVPADPPPLRTSEIHDLVGHLSSMAIDEAVVMTSFHQSPLPLALLLRMAGVSRIGAVSVDYPGSLLDVRHQVGEGVHEVERNLSLVAAFGYPLPPGDDGRLRTRRTPDARPAGLPVDPYVVVHPGASVPARAWSPERYAAVVAAVAAAGWNVVVTGGPSEEGLCQQVAAAATGVTNLAGTTDHVQMAEVLAGASAVVVGNTGPAHLAAAVGTPVVSIFAPTVPAAAWHPWRVPHALLGDQQVPCAGCRARVCPYQGQPCLAAVAVTEVVAAVAELARHRRDAA